MSPTLEGHHPGDNESPAVSERAEAPFPRGFSSDKYNFSEVQSRYRADLWPLPRSGRKRTRSAIKKGYDLT